jgi:hypothetical protein
MITLYHAPNSRSSRIIWLLEELGVAYTIQPVSIFRPMTGQGHPDPANPHPDQRVPAIEHNDALITDPWALRCIWAMRSRLPVLPRRLVMPGVAIIAHGWPGMDARWNRRCLPPCPGRWRVRLPNNATMPPCCGVWKAA